MRERQIKFRWVRGHAGNKWNERAVLLETKGMGKSRARRVNQFRRGKPKATNNADLRARAARDGLSFDDSLPPWLAP